jgi:hypothetical protein
MYIYVFTTRSGIGRDLHTEQPPPA